MRNGNQPHLDRTNTRILERLRIEGRVAYSALASEMNCSVNTVRDRIMAMERRGVIRGYRAVVQAEAAGHTVRALVLVAQDPYHAGTPVQVDLGQIPGCVGAHRTSGQHAIAFEITAKDHSELHQIIHKHIYTQGYTQAKIVPLGERCHPIGATPKTPRAQAFALEDETPAAATTEGRAQAVAEVAA